MDARTGSLLILLVALITVAMIVQAISLLIFVLSFRKFCNRVEVLLDQFSRDVQPVLHSARELLTEGREKFHAISSNILEITGMAKGQVARLDGMLTDASKQARLQFIRLDQLLTDTIGRMEETSEAVRRTILTPVREVSALLAGLRASLDFLFRRNKAGVERPTQDEELFI